MTRATAPANTPLATFAENPRNPPRRSFLLLLTVFAALNSIFGVEPLLALATPAEGFQLLLRHLELLLEKGDEDRARVLLPEAMDYLKINPRRGVPLAELLNRWAAKLVAGGTRFAAARELFQQALAVDPRNRQVMWNLAQWHIRQKNFSEALPYLEHLDHPPRADPLFLKCLGNLLVKLNFNDRAIAVFERLIHASPRDSYGHFALSTLHFQQERIGPAHSACLEALAIEPENPRFRQHLNRLEGDLGRSDSHESLEGGHFAIYYPKSIAASTASRILELLETTHEEYRAIFDHAPQEPTIVILHQAGKSNPLNQFRAPAVGLFDGKIRLDARELSAQTDEIPRSGSFYRAARHELSHLFTMSLDGGKAPAWAHEGIAQALEGHEENGTMRVRRLGRLDDLASSSLTSALEGFSPRATETQLKLAYAASGWVMEQAVAQNGPNLFPRFLEQLGRGKRSSRAFSEVFEIPWDSLEKRFLALAHPPP